MTREKVAKLLEIVDDATTAQAAKFADFARAKAESAAPETVALLRAELLSTYPKSPVLIRLKQSDLDDWDL